uniref:hypothetical protein n=1 Tax=Thaumasiovibrio occultus TaxID=1891184 RepID=UPI000B359C40|nr:hypothetical protein [Thaumasiovibrio occultus]
MKPLKPHHKAKELIKQLSALNCTIRTVTQKPHALLITIEKPTPELTHRSIEITEIYNGQTRRLRAARHSGCCIVWEA